MPPRNIYCLPYHLLKTKCARMLLPHFSGSPENFLLFAPHTVVMGKAAARRGGEDLFLGSRVCVAPGGEAKVFPVLHVRESEVSL